MAWPTTSGWDAHLTPFSSATPAHALETELPQVFRPPDPASGGSIDSPVWTRNARAMSSCGQGGGVADLERHYPSHSFPQTPIQTDSSPTLNESLACSLHVSRPIHTVLSYDAIHGSPLLPRRVEMETTNRFPRALRAHVQRLVSPIGSPST
jgi:hypothetical protein